MFKILNLNSVLVHVLPVLHLFYSEKLSQAYDIVPAEISPKVVL